VESPRSHSGVEKDLYSSAWITKDGDSRGPRITLDRSCVERVDTQSIGSRRTVVQDLG
jgi:hypothetical protein